MELTLDEFIIDWHLSNVANERETAESIVRIVKNECHKLVFDNAYFDRFRAKLGAVRKQRKGDTYVTIVLVKRFGQLMFDKLKVRICVGRSVEELKSISDDLDRLVVKSTLCIQSEKKIFVTPDSELIEEAKALSRYGIEGLQPNGAERLLTESPCIQQK